MRATLFVVCVGVVTLSRMKRAFVAATLWVVTLAVLPVTLVTVVKLVPLALTWMLNVCVLKLVLSRPRQLPNDELVDA